MFVTDRTKYRPSDTEGLLMLATVGKIDAWPFLWAMHSLHHSDASVNVTTTPRHFWVESAIKVLFIYPLAAVLLKPSAVILGAYIAMGYWNFVSHMNVRLSFGRFWFVLNSPQYHRIHHAADARYADCNFAALFRVYDLIFLGLIADPRRMNIRQPA